MPALSSPLATKQRYELPFLVTQKQTKHTQALKRLTQYSFRISSQVLYFYGAVVKFEISGVAGGVGGGGWQIK